MSSTPTSFQNKPKATSSVNNVPLNSNSFVFQMDDKYLFDDHGSIIGGAGNNGIGYGPGSAGGSTGSTVINPSINLQSAVGGNGALLMGNMNQDSSMNMHPRISK